MVYLTILYTWYKALKNVTIKYMYLQRKIQYIDANIV